MTTKSIDWGFSELASGSGALESDQALWRPKAELFMALNGYGIGNFEDLEDLIDNEFLGNGTSFKVHACNSRKTSELVAVKRLIRTNSSNQNRLIKVLQREFQILSFEPLRETTTLVNILGYAWKHSADLPSVVIEYANYGTLQKFLFNKGNFVDNGWNLCRSLCLDVAVALEVLHAHGIIHGDLKMENVLVYWDEAKYATAKVSDFGHSVFHLAAEESASYIGTPIYNPPEVLRLANADAFVHMNVEQLSKCDVWSFGLMVWCTMNAGESYFQDQWLSQGRIYVDRLDFLINQPPNYLQLASSEFIRDFEALASAPASLKIVFADLLWKCLHSVSEERCTMRDASILLDLEREWQHSMSTDVKREISNLEKNSFRTLQVFDCIDSDIPWHFRKALFEDLVKTKEIRQGPSKSPDGIKFRYITSYEHVGSREEGDYDTNQAWPLAVCYATGFGVDTNLESMFKYLELDFKISGHTEIFLDRIKYAHGKHLQGELQRSRNSSWQHDEWFAESIHAYQSGMYKAHRLGMISACFKSVYFHLQAFSDHETLLNAAAEFPDENLEITCRDELTYVRPLLHFAVDMDDAELLRGLIQRGVDVDQQDAESRTALFEACTVGNLELALFLLAAGANPSLRDSCGTYPLHLLIFFGSNQIIEIGKALVDAGAEPNVSMFQAKAWDLTWHGIAVSGTPLRFAVSCRNAEAIRVLLNIGADVNYRVHFLSSLDVAVAYHLPEICSMLIEGGAKVENYWVTGRSPLHGFGNLSLCPTYGKWMIHGSKFSAAATATIQLAIQHGADIQARDKHGETSLSIAIKDRTDDMYVAKTILRQYDLLGISVDPSLIFPAIEASSFNNSCSKITELLKYGFEQTLQNSDGNTPLHHCVIKGAAAALRKLITFPSINLDLPNQDGFTPLHLTSKTDSNECLAILCENGASVNSRVDNSEDVALTLALGSGNTEAFYLLLENNADAWLGNRESNGPTILHRICQRELLSQPMNPAFVGDKGMPILHAPPTSLASDIFYHEKSDKLYALIARQPALLNARDRNGCTCLHIAIKGADLAAVEILLHGGADRFLCENSGLKPLEYLELVLERIKKWRGGYSAQLDGIFDEVCRLLQD